MLMHNRGSGGGGGGGGGFMVMLRSALRSSMRVHAAASFNRPLSEIPTSRPVPGSPFLPASLRRAIGIHYRGISSSRGRRRPRNRRESRRAGCMPLHVNIKFEIARR